MASVPTGDFIGETLMDYGRWKVLWLDYTYLEIFAFYLEIGVLYGYCEELEEEVPEIAGFAPEDWN